MTIFVTGGSGFLGQELVKLLLESGYTVRALSRQERISGHERLEWIRGSLTDLEALQKGCRGAHAVMHVAALTGIWGRYGPFFKANILGTQCVLVAARREQVPYLIYTSSPSVVYNGGPIEGGTEGLPYIKPGVKAPHYAFTKAYAEWLVLRGQDLGRLHTLALRPHLIWGQGDPHLVARLLKKGASGRLWQVGPGSNRVSLTHVRHAAQAHLDALLALEQDASVGGEAYFINDPEPVSLWSWIGEVLEAAGLPQVRHRLSLSAAYRLGACLEFLTPSFVEPPLTRFLANQLGQPHTFSIEKAQRALGYAPSGAYAYQQLEALKTSLRAKGATA